LKALNDMTATAGCETQAYDKVTIRLHWATAVLVAIQFLIGRTTNFLPRGPLRVDIWSVHVMLGFALAVVVVGLGNGLGPIRAVAVAGLEYP